MASTKSKYSGLFLILVILAPFLSLGSQAVPAVAGQSPSTCRSFDKLQVCDRFLEVWNKQGSEQASLYVNGLPITARRTEISLTDGKLYEIQWFERARYEAHPENQAPFDVLLGLLGITLTEGRSAGSSDPADAAFARIAQPDDADGVSKVWFTQTGHSLSGKILEYWNRYGGLPQFGYPLSEPFEEVSATDGKTYTVQYFERNRFELHPANQAPYDVELGLLGVQQYKATAVAAGDLPINPPQGVTSAKDTAQIGLARGLYDLYGHETADLLDTAGYGAMILDAIEDQLVAQDQFGNYYPEDAYYIPTRENGGSYYVGFGEDRHLVTKYKIRRGIKWNNGKELTAEDAVATFKRKTLEDVPSSDRGLWRRISSVVAADPYTVVYNWLSLRQARDKYNNPSTDRSKYGFLEEFVDQGQPVSADNYYLVGDIQPEHKAGNRSPLGTGPFKVGSWNSDSIILVQNEHYTLTAKPLLKQIAIRFSTDQNRTIADLNSGRLDAATGEVITLAPNTGNVIELANSFKVAYLPSLTWEHLDFNFQYGPFKDRAVREAIIRGINRQEIVNRAFFGKAPIVHSVQSPAAPISLQNEAFAARWGEKYHLPQYDFDPSKAAQLLDAAGWVRGENGIRQKNGQELRFRYVTTVGNVIRNIVVQVVQDNLASLGIDAQVDLQPAGKLYGVPDGTLATGAYELSEFAWIFTGTGDFDVWGTGNSQNYQRYSNPAVEALLSQLHSAKDPDVSDELSARLQVTLMEDIPVVPLFTRVNVDVATHAFQNWHMSMDLGQRFHNVAQWYFK